MEARVYEGPVRLQPSCGSNATSRLGPRRDVVAIELGGCRIIVARRDATPTIDNFYLLERDTCINSRNSDVTASRQEPSNLARGNFISSEGTLDSRRR